MEKSTRILAIGLRAEWLSNLNEALPNNFTLSDCTTESFSLELLDDALLPVELLIIDEHALDQNFLKLIEANSTSFILLTEAEKRSAYPEYTAIALLSADQQMADAVNIQRLKDRLELFALQKEQDRLRSENRMLRQSMDEEVDQRLQLLGAEQLYFRKITDARAAAIRRINSDFVKGLQSLRKSRQRTPSSNLDDAIKILDKTAEAWNRLAGRSDFLTQPALMVISLKELLEMWLSEQKNLLDTLNTTVELAVSSLVEVNLDVDFFLYAFTDLFHAGIEDEGEKVQVLVEGFKHEAGPGIRITGLDPELRDHPQFELLMRMMKLAGLPVSRMDSDYRIELVFKHGDTAVLHKKRKKDAANTPEIELAFAGKTALIADDNDINLLVNSKMLEDFGYSVIQAADGQEAIEAGLQRPYDLLLIDIRMPRADGFQVSKRLKMPDSPNADGLVVLCTAYPDEVDFVKMHEVGAKAVLGKPLRARDLLRVIRDHIGGRLT
jgi:CheY-like chemotaxis protein